MTALILSFFSVPVFANPGLTVGNPGIILTVSPGQVIVQKIPVSISGTDAPTDISIRVTGLFQSFNGGSILLDPAQDTGQYSARSFVTVDKNSFHLDPGQSVVLTATIAVPQNADKSSYYAIINIANPPSSAGSNVAIVTAINIPVYLTIKDSQLLHQGKITDLKTNEVTNGQPVNITTTFQNTGNIYFKVRGEVTITNAQGATLDTVSIPLTGSSILPDMSRDLQVNYVPSAQLKAGTYQISSKVMLDDGTILDQSNGTFTVKTAYVPPKSTSTPGAPVSAGSVSSTPAATSASTNSINLTLIVGVIAGVIIIVLLVILVMQRGRSKKG